MRAHCIDLILEKFIEAWIIFRTDMLIKKSGQCERENFCNGWKQKSSPDKSEELSIFLEIR